VLSAQPGLHYFAAEAAPFLAAAAQSAHVGVDGAALLAAERPLLSVSVAGAGYRGRAAPASPVAAASARATLAADDATMLANYRHTYGYRGFVFDLPPIVAPPNKMDAFIQAVQSRDAAWLTVSPQAATSVRVLLNGQPVTTDAAGRFTLPASAAGGLLEAIDGAGGRTDLTVG
jgi:hypothetical protein